MSVRFYRRDQEDKLWCLNRCYFDAEHARVDLALTRLHDLQEEFPDDAKVLYAQGDILRRFLGQGLAARELFHCAYQASHDHLFSAFNAAHLAASAEEYHHWIDIAERLAPADPDVSTWRLIVDDALGAGTPLSRIQLDYALRPEDHRQASQTDTGMRAALIEVAMERVELPPEEEAGVRRTRAQSLRALDLAAENHRATLGEAFLPEERLALHGAVDEISRALDVDSADAECWNLKSAWCYLLDRCDEALTCADRAIELRPTDYPKPHYNKARVLTHLDRRSEATACTEESLRQSVGPEFATDAKLARDLLQELATVAETPPPPVEPRPLAEHILNAATLTCDQEMGEEHRTVPEGVASVFQRTEALRGQWRITYVPIVAQFLEYNSPESVFTIIAQVSQRDPRVHEHWCFASLYLAVHGTSVVRRDAARFTALNILAALDLERVRDAYRLGVLEPTSAATDEFRELDRVMRQELRRINPLFPELIAEQEPVDEAGRQRAIRTTLSRFQGHVPTSAELRPTTRSTPHTGRGTLLLLAMGMLLLAMVVIIILWLV